MPLGVKTLCNDPGATTSCGGTHAAYHAQPTLRSILPFEVLDYVFRELTRSELIPVLCTNSVFHALSVRRVYHTIANLRPRDCILCLRSLDANPSLPPYLRALELNFSTRTPTGNMYHLVHRVLKRAVALHSLHIELPKSQSPVWILDDTPFALRKFTTSMQCKRSLANYLESQPSITELTLRGFQSDHGISTLPFFDTPPPHIEPPEERFCLGPTALPNLSVFNAIHAGPAVIASVVTGRPIRVVSIPLFPASAEEALNALQLGSCHLQRLSIISFDPDAPKFLFPEVARRFPQLEALHIVVLMASCTKEQLEASGPLLSRFKSLRYITFMAASSEGSTRNEECIIARQWHESCPTLQTIILPKGRVWFQGTDDWASLDD
ncbi:hypothetical protein BDQ12DRAFT_630977 [Crucibulum laeve]|uniref:F-box domain-containing protein n=1 Tax=Crucibulum laeve TaxID=68775 RepID=A0A5C3LZS1_9AGAR|nr:hypothetical protein BDQ12DRAFT_630977 [Crucibulum laeve]